MGKLRDYIGKCENEVQEKYAKEVLKSRPRYMGPMPMVASSIIKSPDMLADVVNVSSQVQGVNLKPVVVKEKKKLDLDKPMRLKIAKHLAAAGYTIEEINNVIELSASDVDKIRAMMQSKKNKAIRKLIYAGYTIEEISKVIDLDNKEIMDILSELNRKEKVKQLKK